MNEMQMLALRKINEGSGAELVHTAVPRPGPDDVLVKVDIAAICGSDVPLYQRVVAAEDNLRIPFTLGHEFSGTVVERGANVSALKPGDRVSGETHYPCGSCYQCTTGEPHICANLKLVGRQIDGCFAEYCTLPQICARKVPQSLAPHQAALLEPLGVAVHAITEAQVWGNPVAILGIGPIGAMAVAVATHMGATRVFATSRTPAKLQIALEMGATRALNPNSEDVVREVLDETNGVGVGAVIDLTGDSVAVDQGFRMLRKGGRLVFVAAIAGPMVLDMRQHILWKEAKVSGIHGRRMFETWHLAEDLVASGKVGLDRMMGETHPLSEAKAAFHAAKAGSIGRVFLKP